MAPSSREKMPKKGSVYEKVDHLKRAVVDRFTNLRALLEPAINKVLLGLVKLPYAEYMMTLSEVERIRVAEMDFKRFEADYVVTVLRERTQEFRSGAAWADASDSDRFGNFR